MKSNPDYKPELQLVIDSEGIREISILGESPETLDQGRLLYLKIQSLLNKWNIEFQEVNNAEKKETG